MNRKNFLGVLACILVTSCTSYEEPTSSIESTLSKNNSDFVTLSEAMKDAEQVFSLVYESEKRSGLNIKDVQMLKSSTRSQNDQNTHGYYIVNFENEGGFTILSADKRKPRVCAISNSGSIHLSDTLVNRGLSWYLNVGLSDLIYDPNPKDTIVHEQVIFETRKTTYSEPLMAGLLSNFHQSLPYNKYCIFSSGSSKVGLTGCLPLAAGAIMGYYKWPESYGGYKFNWDAMNAIPYEDGWSKLFFYLGQNQNFSVVYGEKFTGANPYRIPYVFNNFKYKNTKYEVFSFKTVTDELKSGHPILCVGFPNNSIDGHAWIIDGGYQLWSNQGAPVPPSTEPTILIDEYLHCVWGYGGKANGYFLYNGYLGGRPSGGSDDGSNESVTTFNKLFMGYGFSPDKN
ncbi:MAG: C10 family peptidase [Muribaculaceae bacterium]|nr:C10 family peptidase [Muribaculaceae bacterium]